LEVKYVAPMLSHQRVGGCVRLKPSSEQRERI
jgi:hypothetical protein